MNTENKKVSHIIPYLIIAATLLFAIFSHYTNIFDHMDAYIYDTQLTLKSRFPSSKKISPNIVHIDLTDSAIFSLNIENYERSIYPELIKILTNAGVNSIVFDVCFPRQQNAEIDSEMGKIVREAKNVYLPVIPIENKLITQNENCLTHENYNFSDITSISEVNSIITSYCDLQTAACGYGHIRISSDKDGVYRKTPIFYRSGHNIIPMLSFKVACDYLKITPDNIDFIPGNKIILHDACFPSGVIKNITIPLDKDNNIGINFSGKWGSVFPHYRIDKILQISKDTESLSALYNELHDAIVIIADITTATGDHGVTPLETLYPLPGIQSTIINSIIMEDNIIYLDDLFYILFYFTVYLVIIFLLPRLQPIKMAITLVTFCITITIASFVLLIFFNCILSLPDIIISIGICCFNLFLMTFINEHIDKVRLEAINTGRDDFITEITHELKTPLSLIVAPITSLIEGKHGDFIKSSDNYLYTIKRNSEKLSKLVNSYMDYTKYESGFIHFSKNNISLSELADKVLSSFIVLARQLGLKYHFTIEPEIIFFCNSELIEKVIYNLTSNAFKYTPVGSAINISLFTKNDKIVFVVEDEGIGIPEEKQNAIFEKFVRLSKPFHSQFESSGVGLYLTSKIVKEHSGNITLRSTPGKGSVFSVFFDIENMSENQLSSINNEVKKTNEYKVMIVEDDSYLNSYLNTILSAEYNTICFNSPIDAINNICSFNPDAIISDINMPAMNGLDFIQKIKESESTQEIPVIFLTASSQISDRINAFKYGAVDYMIKPFFEDELLSRLKLHCEYKEIRNTIITGSSIYNNKSDHSIIDFDSSLTCLYSNATAKNIFGDIKNGLDICGGNKNKFIELQKTLSQAEKEGGKIFFFHFSGVTKIDYPALCNCSIILTNRTRVKSFRLFIMNIGDYINKTIMPDDNFLKTYDISKREADILIQLLHGYNNKEIADKLFITQNTVKTHIKNIYEKMNINSRDELLKKVYGNIKQNNNELDFYFNLLHDITE